MMLISMKVFACCSALKIALVGAVLFDFETDSEMVKRKALEGTRKALEFLLIFSPS